MPLGRLGHPAQDFQQRALAGAIAADNADDLAGLNGKRHVLERPEFGTLAGEIAASTDPFVPKTRKKMLHLLTHGLCIELPQLVAFGEIFNFDNGTRHGV